MPLLRTSASRSPVEVPVDLNCSVHDLHDAVVRPSRRRKVRHKVNGEQGWQTLGQNETFTDRDVAQVRLPSLVRQ